MTMSILGPVETFIASADILVRRVPQHIDPEQNRHDRTARSTFFFHKSRGLYSIDKPFHSLFALFPVTYLSAEDCSR